MSLSPNAWQANIEVAGVAKQLPEVDSGQSKRKHLEEHHAAKASSMYCGMPPFLDSRTAASALEVQVPLSDQQGSSGAIH